MSTTVARSQTAYPPAVADKRRASRPQGSALCRRPWPDRIARVAQEAEASCLNLGRKLGFFCCPTALPASGTWPIWA